MSIERGRVVGVLVGGEASYRPGLVLDVLSREGNSEPLVTVAVAYDTVDGGPATVATLTSVPHFADAPDAHWRWNYGGPELLVRKPLPADPATLTPDPTSGSGSVTPPAPVTPDATGGAAV